MYINIGKFELKGALMQGKKQMTLEAFLATWCGSGLLSDKAAGTISSLCSLPLCWLLMWVASSYSAGVYTYAVATVLIFFIGVLVIPDAEKWLGVRQAYDGVMKWRDQNQMTVDEAVGMLISCFPIVFFHYSWFVNFLASLLSFGLFRVFDIWKWWLAKKFDDWESEWGVMLDDVAAGVYAAAVLTPVLLIAKRCL